MKRKQLYLKRGISIALASTVVVTSVPNVIMASPQEIVIDESELQSKESAEDVILSEDIEEEGEESVAVQPETYEEEDTEVAAVQDENRVLELKMEDNLDDTSGNEHAVSVVGNNFSYVDGAKEGTKALQLNGNTYLNLGTSSDLNSSSLTYSFWVNPGSSNMSGEHMFLWNKEEWYTDGWYVASQDKKPIIISIGSADAGKQPYQVAVSADRTQFFPTDIWTQVTITFDETTKDVVVYRNGLKQNSSVVYPIGTGGADGVIDSDNTMQKSIGYNGPKYNGAYLKAALDHVVLLNKAANQEEVLAIYEETKTFDYQTLVDADKEAMTLPSSAFMDLELPTTGKNGSSVTWSSSDQNIISDDGKVTVPESDETVTMTATFSKGGKTAQKTFEVRVAALKLTNNEMDKVTLLDSYLQNAEAKDVEYLLSMSSEKFLYEFYKTAGLTPTTDSGYGGWERSNGNNFRSHFFGHYMSALSQAYLGSKDEDTKSALLEQIEAAVNGLDRCQKAFAEKYPESAGYISAFPEGRLTDIDGVASSQTATSSNTLVPYYNLHKVLAGLIDIAKNVDGETGKKALVIAENYGEYFYKRLSKLTDKDKMLSTEYGGMNEALYELYNITGNDHYKTAAEYFDETTLFTQLAAGNDVLSGKHANTTIPKLIGALKRYMVLEGTNSAGSDLEMYKTAAVNFWDIVVEHHTYITGGNSRAEHFHGSDVLAGDMSESNCETCNTYNMLKLSRMLFQVTGDKKYMDYYENTYINAILSSQNPETGMMMYFQPMGAGYSKIYNTPYESFWCCTGTGIENFTKLGDTIYLERADGLYVNMFQSSSYDKDGLSLTQTANMPNEDTFSIQVNNNTANKTVKVRIPDWVAGEITVKKNGSEIEYTEQVGYLVFEGLTAGDKLDITYPMEVQVYDLPDNKNMVAFKYGPVVLSAGLGSNDIEAWNPNGIMVRVSTLDSSVPNTITLQSQSAEDWKNTITKNLVRIEDSEDGKVQFKLQGTDLDNQVVYTPHFMQHTERYGLYMKLAEPDSKELQASILEEKLQKREEEASSDLIVTFDNNNSEMSHNVQASDNSSVGTWSGRTYRDARAGGWFCYDLKISETSGKQYLSTTYYGKGGDDGRSFDIYINGEKFVNETINGTDKELTSDGFYTVRREIPEKYLTGETINVKFQSTGGLVGGLYGLSVNSDYDTNASLKELSFDKGTLSPELSESETSYTLTVPKGTDSVQMTAKTLKESGLVYIGDILFDNSRERTIVLDALPKTVQLTTKAQDHETEKTYTIEIVEGQETPSQDEDKITITETAKDKEITKQLPEDQTGVIIELIQKDGATGPSRVSAKVSDKGLKAGEKVRFYKVDETSGKLISTGKTYTVDANGKVTLELTEGKYVLAKVISLPMNQVKNVKLKSTTDKVTISWSKVAGADGYRVYRYDRTQGKYVKIANEVKGTSFTDKNRKAGTGYIYKVRAYKMVTKMHYSDYTTAKVLTKLQAPTSVKAKRTTAVSTRSKATLSFKTVKNATTYRIYKYNKKTKKYEITFRVIGNRLYSYNAKTKKYTKVNNVTVKNGVMTCTLVNLNLRSEKSQTYMVRSTISKTGYETQYSEYSKTVTVK